MIPANHVGQPAGGSVHISGGPAQPQGGSVHISGGPAQPQGGSVHIGGMPIYAPPMPPQNMYIPPMPPPNAYGQPASIVSILAAYGLPPACPICGTQIGFAPLRGSPQFQCGYPVTTCINTPVKVEIVEDTGCICHITMLISKGCQSTRGLPCPSRKK